MTKEKTTATPQQQENLKEFKQALKLSELQHIDPKVSAWIRLLEDAASAVKSTESKTAIYEHLQPRDPIEIMMISQMILMHELSVMVHLRATEEYKNGFIKTPAYASTACKISGAYIRLVEALDSYRGKQKTQHIRVEQVMVESGANAIVGNVNVEGGGRRNG